MSRLCFPKKSCEGLGNLDFLTKTELSIFVRGKNDYVQPQAQVWARIIVMGFPAKAKQQSQIIKF